MSSGRRSLRGHPTSIEIQVGETYMWLAAWEHPADGEFQLPRGVAYAGRNQLSAFIERSAEIQADKRLSAEAKRDDILADRQARLRELGTRQRDLNAFRQQIDQRRRALARVEAASPTEAIYEVELARLFREVSSDDRMKLIAQLAAGEHPEMVTALMRAPRALWPMTPEAREAITTNWVARSDPEGSAHLAQLAAAASTAQRVLSRSVTELSDGLDLRQRMTSLGADAWQQHVRDGAPDALAALADRYAEDLAQ